MIKNINLKIPEEVWKIIKQHGHSCVKLAEFYLTKYAEKINNEPLIIELKPKQTDSDEIFKPSKSVKETKPLEINNIESYNNIINTKIEDEIEDELDPNTYYEDINDNSEELTPLAEGSNIPKYDNNYNETIIDSKKPDTFWDDIAKEQKEKYGPKLTSKEKNRKEKQENEELCKKFGKDPSKYSFANVDDFKKEGCGLKN